MRTLSKSKIISFRQCPKRLWLEVHRPELKEDSAATEAVYRVGNQVGEVAKQIYAPDGHATEIDAQRDGYDVALPQSAELLAQPNQVLFEAGLKSEGLLAFADVMLPQVDGWNMVEVKSSTSVKDYHREDAAVQTLMAARAGVKLHSVALACVDNAWVYPGGGDYRGLLKETDLTEESLALQEEVGQWVQEAHRVADLEEEPDIATGPQCTDPFVCGFCNYCSSNEPQPEHPLTWLPRLQRKKRERLQEQGIEEIGDVPDADLNAQQRRVKHCTINNEVHLDREEARAALPSTDGPALFLDFETSNFAVPVWVGTRPYQQVPFQYSLHLRDEDGAMTHRSFLELSGENPSRPLAEALVTDCGADGPIFVYNAGFERGVIRSLAAEFPELAPALQAISDRIFDLLPVTRSHYYHPDQQGSWSIKAVLPTIGGDLSYSELEGVADGSQAIEAFAEAINPSTTQERKDEIRAQLEEYCRLDTLAMVRLWEFLLSDSSSS